MNSTEKEMDYRHISQTNKNPIIRWAVSVIGLASLAVSGAYFLLRDYSPRIACLEDENENQPIAAVIVPTLFGEENAQELYSDGTIKSNRADIKNYFELKPDYLVLGQTIALTRDGQRLGNSSITILLTDRKLECIQVSGNEIEAENQPK